MNVARTLEVRGVAILDVCAARLEVAAVRAAGNFFVCVVAGQPHLDVVGLARGKAQVARAQRNNAVGQLELLQQIFGFGSHALELGIGIFGRGKLHHLDLVELVLANDASRVAAGRASLFAEARRERGVPLRQIGSIEHFARMQVGKHDFSGGDKEVVAGNVIRVVFELGKLARAEHGLTLHDDRRPPFFETAGRVRIEEIVDERALKTSACAAEHRETAARELIASIEIEDVQIGAKIPMRLEIEIELARRAPATALGVFAFVFAHRSGVARNVRRSHQNVIELGVDFPALGACLGELFVDLANLLLGSFGLFLFASAHELADFLRSGIAFGLQAFLGGDSLATLLVERREQLGIPWEIAVRHCLGNGFLVIANIANIKHGLALLQVAAARGAPPSVALSPARIARGNRNISPKYSPNAHASCHEPPYLREGCTREGRKQP